MSAATLISRRGCTAAFYGARGARALPDSVWRHRAEECAAALATAVVPPRGVRAETAVAGR